MSAESKLKTNPVCPHSEADPARQAISLGRPKDWEQGVGRRKKDGPEWLTGFHGWDKEEQEGNHHHAMQKIGILEKATTTMHSRRWESWRQQSETWDNEDRAIIWALQDLLNLDSTPSRNWLLTTGRKVQVWNNAIIQNNQTTGCLAREDSTPKPRNKHQDPSYKNKQKKAAG